MTGTLFNRRRDHAARSVGAGAARSGKTSREIPFSFATRSMDGMRQWGIVPAFFQLETVDGGALMALATSTVPPRAAIICSAVIM